MLAIASHSPLNISEKTGLVPKEHHQEKAYDCDSARMSKITNEDLTRSDTRCFIVVPI